MTNKFVDVLGDSLDNIKTINKFLNEEDHIFLISAAIRAQSLYFGDKLHLEAIGFLDDNKVRERTFKINEKILQAAEEAYGTKFINYNKSGLNIHKINSFTDAHTDIIERTPGPQIPGQVEPEYPNWRDAWDGYLACNVYLNDDYSGGEVYFPERNYEFKPVENSLVMWPGNKNFIHGIKKTTGCNRYVFGLFIKFAEFDKYDK